MPLAQSALLSLFCPSACLYLSLPLFPPASLSPLVLCPHSLPFTPGPLSLPPHISLSLSPSWWQRVYLLLIFWLGSLPAPLSPHFSSSLPYFTRGLTRHAHTHTHIDAQVCVRVWDEKVVITLSVYWDTCVCSSHWDRKRETKWESTHSKRKVSIFRSV